MDGSVLEEKSSINICGGWLLPSTWIGALTLSVLLKLPPRKLEPWFVLWSFFLLRLLCISINLLYGHRWNTVAMSGPVLLVATELAQLVPLPYSRRKSTCYSDRLHDFPVTIHWCYKNVYVMFLFSHRHTLEFLADRMLSFDLWPKWP